MSDGSGNPGVSVGENVGARNCSGQRDPRSGKSGGEGHAQITVNIEF